MATTVTSNERDIRAPRTSWMRWAGRVLTALPVLVLAFSATLKLMHAPNFVAVWTGKLGWQESTLSAIGLLELACLIVYAIPRTAFIGAILLSGYLGGAVATHVRIGDPFAIPIVLGVVVWAGLYLRDERIRALVAWR